MVQMNRRHFLTVPAMALVATPGPAWPRRCPSCGGSPHLTLATQQYCADLNRPTPSRLWRRDCACDPLSLCLEPRFTGGQDRRGPFCVNCGTDYVSE